MVKMPAILDKYIENLQGEYLSVQIFQMRKSVNLQDLYIIPRFLDEIPQENYDGLRAGRRVGHYNRIVSFKEMETFKERRRTLILGDPGAGKSSLLRMIAATTLIKNADFLEIEAPYFPVYVELRRYAENIVRLGKLSPLEHFAVSLFDRQDDLEEISNLAKSGKVVFLFDALDEVPTDLHRIILDQVSSNSNDYPKCPVIMSSRIGEKTRPRNYQAFEIVDFSSDDREEFINKWFSLIGAPERATKLVASINNTPAIREITTNPLLLSLICTLYKSDHDLPSQRSEIFERCIQILVREWDTDRDFRRKSRFSGLTDEKRIQIISEIAYYYLSQSKRYFSEDDLSRFLDGVIDDYELEEGCNRELIHEISSHYGIIVPARYANFGFSHLSFQEYLTARYIVKSDQFDTLLSRYSENKRWLETVLFAAGRIGSFGLLFETIIDNDDLTSSDKFNLVLMVVRITNITIEKEYRFDLFNYLTRYLEDHILGRIKFKKYKDDLIPYQESDFESVDEFKRFIESVSVIEIGGDSHHSLEYSNISSSHPGIDPLFIISSLGERKWFIEMMRDYSEIQSDRNYKRFTKILANPLLSAKGKMFSRPLKYVYGPRKNIQK